VKADGQVLSELARRALTPTLPPGTEEEVRHGVPLLPPRPDARIVTPQAVQELLEDQEPAMVPSMDYAAVLAELAGFFEERRAPYAVVGGLGLRAYGLARATFDLDLAAEARAQSDLVEHLEALGYTTLHRSDAYSNHLHEAGSMGRVDVVYVRGETAEQLFGQARSTEILPGVTVPVPRPEHLIAMKVHAMASDPSRSFQELADIRHLMQQEGVDRTMIREAFEKRGLLERYRELEKTL
jgi:hypothetical protein